VRPWTKNNRDDVGARSSAVIIPMAILPAMLQNFQRLLGDEDVGGQTCLENEKG